MSLSAFLESTHDKKIKSDEKMSISTLRNYADYQASTFRDALKDDSKKEKRKNQKTKNPKVAVTKMGVFELSDQQFQINMGEIQKLPNFMKFYSGTDFEQISFGARR